MALNPPSTTLADLRPPDRHRLLTSERRRLTLDILEGTGTAVDLEELGRGIVAREDGIDAVDEEAVLRVAIALHHVHLPLIAEMGVLEYDPTTRVVRSS